METSPKGGHSLSTILMTSVFSIYFIIIVLTTSIRILVEYQNAEKEIYKEMESIIETFRDPLSESLWEFNDLLLSSTVNGIMKNPIIKGVEVRSFFGDLKKIRGITKNSDGEFYNSLDGKNIKINETDSEEIIAFNFKILHKDAGKKGKRVLVGKGSFYSSRLFIKEKIWRTFTYILLSEFIKTISIFIFFIWIFKKILGDPLKKLTSSIERIDLNEIDSEPIKVFEKNEGGRELTIFQDSFNKMKKDLKETHESLRDYSSSLEDKVENRAKDLKNLLENLGQGFMVFNKEGIVQPGCSNVTLQLFGCDPTNKKFSEVLQYKKDDKLSLDSWIKNAWKGKISFREIAPLAPKSFEKLERFIELEYRPIYNEKKGAEKKLERVICIASDKTKERELEKIADKEKSQAHMILKIISDKNGFNSMIREVKRNISDIKRDIIEKNEKIDLKNIFRIMHTSKGAFSSYSMKELANLAHRFEDQILKIENNDINLDEDSRMFNNLRTKINYLEEKLENFLEENKMVLEGGAESGNGVKEEQLIEKFKQFILKREGDKSKIYQDFTGEFYSKKISECFERFIPIVKELEERLGKPITLKIEQSPIIVNFQFYEPFILSCIHIFRNCADHGIEDTEERIANGKEVKGLITVRFKKVMNDKIQIAIKDDGRGITPKKIKEVVISKDILSAKEVNNLPDSKILQLIFHEEFSSKDEVTEFSGRGVGLSAVMEEVKKLNGNILVASKDGSGTSFMISLPLILS